MDEFQDGPQLGDELPPTLDLWLRRVQEDVHATWEQSTAAALQKIRADLSTALAATDAKLTGTLNTRLAQTADRLSEELSAKVDAGIAAALEAGVGASDGASGQRLVAPSTALLAEVRTVLARVAAEQADVRSRLAQVEAGLVDLADGLVPHLAEAAERVRAEPQSQETASIVRREVEAVLAPLSGQQAEIGTRLAELENAIGRVGSEKLASSLATAVAQATERLRDELTGMAREHAAVRARLTQMETALGRLTEERLASAFATGVTDATERLREGLAGVGREQAAIRTRLNDVAAGIAGLSGTLARQLADARKEADAQLAAGMAGLSGTLARQLADARKEADAQLAATLATSLGEVTKRLSDEVATNSSMLVGDLEAVLAAAAEKQAAAGKEQDARVEVLVGQVQNLETALERQRQESSAIRAEFLQELSAAIEAQTRTFEQALMSLVKAVGDERRSSAALVRSSLGATDQTLREMFERVDQALAAVLESSRLAAAKASAAASEAKLARRPVADPRS